MATSYSCQLCVWNGWTMTRDLTSSTEDIVLLHVAVGIFQIAVMATVGP